MAKPNKDALRRKKLKAREATRIAKSEARVKELEDKLAAENGDAVLPKNQTPYRRKRLTPAERLVLKSRYKRLEKPQNKNGESFLVDELAEHLKDGLGDEEVAHIKETLASIKELIDAFTHYRDDRVDHFKKEFESMMAPFMEDKLLVKVKEKLNQLVMDIDETLKSIDEWMAQFVGLADEQIYALTGVDYITFNANSQKAFQDGLRFEQFQQTFNECVTSVQAVAMGVQEGAREVIKELQEPALTPEQDKDIITDVEIKE